MYVKCEIDEVETKEKIKNNYKKETLIMKF